MGFFGTLDQSSTNQPILCASRRRALELEKQTTEIQTPPNLKRFDCRHLEKMQKI